MLVCNPLPFLPLWYLSVLALCTPCTYIPLPRGNTGAQTLAVFAARMPLDTCCICPGVLSGWQLSWHGCTRNRCQRFSLCCLGEHREQLLSSSARLLPGGTGASKCAAALPLSHSSHAQLLPLAAPVAPCSRLLSHTLNGHTPSSIDLPVRVFVTADASKVLAAIGNSHVCSTADR